MAQGEPDDTLYKTNLPKEKNEYATSLKDYQMPEFKTYDFTTLPTSFTMIMFAIRRSGKTHLLAEIVHTLRDRFDEVFLFSTTAKYSQEGYNYIPKKNRYNGFDANMLSQILEDQERRLEEKMNNLKNPNIKIPRRLLIFDDVIQDSNIRSSEDFNSLFSRGRHLGGDPAQLSKNELGDFSIVVLSQAVGGKYGIPSVCRRNLDCAVCFYAHSEYDRDILAEQYASVINRKIGDAIVKHVTKEKYTACVFNIQDTGARSYEDYIFKYKAKPKIPHFRIGKDVLEFRSPESSLTIKSYERYQLNLPTIPENESMFTKNIVV